MARCQNLPHAPRASVNSLPRYKVYNTPTQLQELTDPKLIAVGLSNKEDRKVVLAAFRKAGYVYKGKPVTTREAIEKNVVSSPGTGASTLPPMISVRIWN